MLYVIVNDAWATGECPACKNGLKMPFTRDVATGILYCSPECRCEAIAEAQAAIEVWSESRR